MSAPAAPPETAEPAQVDQETPQTETEVPATEVVVEDAAPVEEPAATPEVPQVEVVEEKPNYLTREEWEKEKAEVAARAAAEAIEQDRKRRQTENARKAQNEERQKQRVAQTVDTVKATLMARGIDPEVASEESVVTAIDRVAQHRAEALLQEKGDQVAQVWDYITGQATDLDSDLEGTARELAPKVQAWVNAIRPQIEAKAREGYIAESEIPARVEAEIARRNAKGREGQEELQRPEGSPASTIDRSIDAVRDRIISNSYDSQDEEIWNSRFGRK